VSAQVWHHAVGVRDDTGLMKLYLDGDLKGSVAAPGTDTTGIGIFLLGAWEDLPRYTAREFFSGVIDEAAVYHRALSSAEVAALYQGVAVAVLTVTVGNLPPSVTVDPHTATVAEGQTFTLNQVTFLDPGVLDTHTATIDWGDGTVEDGVVVEPTGTLPGTISGSHVYTNSGTFTVAVRVTDDDGAWATSSTEVTVYRNEPIAAFTAIPNPCACNQSVSLDASNSSHGHPERTIAAYEWDFDYTGTFTVDATGVTTTHAFAAFGTYTVALRVTDDNDPPKTDLTTVVVNVDQGNLPPVADAAGPYQVVLGGSLTLNGSGSYDPDAGCGDSITSYAWNIGGGLLTKSGATPVLSPAEVQSLGAGSFAVVLTVEDSLGATHADTTQLDIVDGMTLSDIAVSSPIDEGSQAVLSGTILNPTAGRPLTLLVDWGDGTPIVTYTYPAGTTSFSEAHTYRDDDPSGTSVDEYAITLTLTDAADVVPGEPLPRYAFTEIARADMAGPSPFEQFPTSGPPSLNGGGVVVFQAMRDGLGYSGIYAGAGGATTRIAEDGDAVVTGTLRLPASDAPTIDDAGIVVFAASADPGGGQAWRPSVWGGGGGALIPYAISPTDPYDGTFSSGYVGGAGTAVIVFGVAWGEDLYLSSGGAPVLLYDSSAISGIGVFFECDINDGGVIAAAAGPGTGLFRSIVRGDGGSLTVIAEAFVDPFYEVHHVSLNNRGEVAFYTRDSTASYWSIHVGNGEALTEVANTIFGTSPFSEFGSYGAAINDAGTVAFLARRWGTFDLGIFAGPDPVADKVILQGEPLLGSTVSSLVFGRFGLNNAGQIAFYASLADGNRVYVRADPIHVATASAAVMVANVAPEITVLGTEPVDVIKDRPFQLDIAFTDPGLLDAHLVTIDWDDGSPPEQLPVPLGQRILSVAHQYAITGSYAISITVSDDDLGEDAKNMTVKVVEMDFGDAPDPTYPTRLASDGARHVIVSGMHLGSFVDPDSDGQPDANALGDDHDAGGNDDDGVRLLTPICPGLTVQLEVIASAAGFLNAWLDLNADGDWDDSGEHFAVAVPLVAGSNPLSFVVPTTAVVTSSTFARFRFSTQADLDYRGWAPDGEVEDYEVEIQPAIMADIAGRSATDGTWWVGESTGSQFASSPWGAWPSVVDWRDVQVADVNGDGRDDIVGRRNGVWWVARSTGSGFVNERWTAWSNTITWENVLVGDFNGDGLDDIVGRANSYWWVALSTGTAFVTQRWGIWSTSSPWEDLHVADVDGDGLDDLVGRQNGVWWVAKSTGTSFVNQKWGVWSTAAPWLDVQVADVNGDGLDDIVGRQSGYWWVAKSTGTSFVNEKWGVWSANVDVRVADVDGDGRDDIVGRVGSNGDWWVARSTGSAFVNQKWGNWTPSLSWTDVQIADVNGDGRYDLVGRETASGAWWVAKSTGTNLVNETWGTWSLASTWMDVCVGDADGDGRADLLGRANGEWWVARSTGSSFDNTRWTTWPHLIPWDDVQVADVNGDGLDDLVGRNNGVWWVAKSTGSGFVNEQWTAWSVSITWEDVMVGDFNGDGLDDIVGRANSYWWVALSTGVAFATQRWGIWSTSAPWEDMLVADVDGDGRDDIVGRQNGIWWVAKSTGTSFVNQKWGVWSTSAAWLDVQVADVNGDGLADIVGRQSGYWWVAKSTGTSFVNEKWGVWSANVDVRVADVNGDGRDDIVGRVGSNGDWWVARSTGSAFVNQKWGNWSTATSWSDVQVADVNGDGRDDIMGRDAAGNWTVAKSTGTAFSNESWGNWSTSISWQDVLVGNFSNRIPGALQAEGSPLASPMSALAVTEEALPSLADAAITRFAAAAGLDEGIDSRLSITFQIADLPGTLLGQSMGQTILIDRNAAGFGWFVDLTPWDDGDFTGSTRGGDLLAAPASAADGRMDLLTVVMHELGHLLNYDHSDTGLMQPTLVPGIRRLFDTHESADDECGLLDWETLLDDQSLDDADLDAYFAAQG